MKAWCLWEAEATALSLFTRMRMKPLWITRPLMYLGLILCGYTFSHAQDVYYHYGDSIDGKVEMQLMGIHVVPHLGGAEAQKEWMRSSMSASAFDTPVADAITALRQLDPGQAVWFKLRIEVKEPIPDTLQLRMEMLSEITAYSSLSGYSSGQEVGLLQLGQRYTGAQDGSTIHVSEPGFQGQVDILLYVRHTTRSTIINKNYFWFYINTYSAIHSSYIAYRPAKDGWSYLYTFFCGLMLFQMVYVGFQGYIMRRTEYTYYALYVMAVFIYFYARFSVYIAESDAVALVDARFMDAVNEPFLILPSFFYFRFARYFIDMKHSDPVLNKRMVIFEWFLLVMLVVVTLQKHIPNGLNKDIAMAVALVSQFLFGIYVLLRMARQKRTVVRFLIWGSGIALGSHLIANLLPILPGNLLYYIAPLSVTMLGILIELVIFNSGLLFKARESERELIRTQREYILELQTRQELQAAYAGVRDRIAGDLHDDIGSSLSSIGIYSFAAGRKLEQGDSTQTRMLIQRISDGTQTLMQRMSDLVWAIHPENDSNEKMLARIQNFALEVTSAKGCRFHAMVSEAFSNFPLNQEQRKNILLILKEAINNVAKHADATEVELSIKALGPNDHPGFEICLSDNGIGFAAEDKEGSGNGLRSMRKRAMELGGHFDVAPGEDGGTKVCFRVVQVAGGGQKKQEQQISQRLE